MKFAHIVSYFPILIVNNLSTNSIAGNTNQYYDSRTLRKVCGILGTINLIDGHYLLVATHREFVGVINGQVIWRLAGHDLIPFHASSIYLTDAQKAYNETYLSMVKHILDTPFFYFSYTYDLTHTLQRLNAVGRDFDTVSSYFV